MVERNSLIPEHEKARWDEETSGFRIPRSALRNPANLLWLLLLVLNLVVCSLFLQSRSSTVPFAAKYPVISNLCDICDCSDPEYASYRFPSSLSPSRASKKSLPAIVQSAIIDSQCSHVYSSNISALAALRQIHSEPYKMMAWNLDGLEMGRPTSFMFTKTFPGGKDGADRPLYMRRHAKTIHAYQNEVNAEGFEDGTRGNERQTVWIIVEDHTEIDQNVAAEVASSGVNFIYFPMGPTHNFGNAQHNAAYNMIYHLTKYFGPGPVVGVDDDAEIHQELLKYIWRVKRIGIWPMGNLGKSGWEGPIVKDGVIVGFDAGNSWRKYPVDNGAFAFTSALLGNVLPGPAFWPTDTNGGETEFIEKIISRVDELELLCNDCHVAWHNHPLVKHVSHMIYRPG